MAWIRFEPNRGHADAPGFTSHATADGAYQLAICEFDDMGEAYCQAQIDAVRQAAEDWTAAGRNVIVAVFVHGWRHNAAGDDPNLLSFHHLLGKLAGREAGYDNRAVFGIFVAWRGLTLRGGGAIEGLTFWGRQRAARRISNGSVRELFGHLHRYRKDRVRHDGSPMLAIAGHSFGALIVYSALEQSLIEAASAGADHLVPAFADLVLLINPAFEASRYLPVDRLRRRRTADTPPPPSQVPVLVCAYAENDRATGRLFPIGNALAAIRQSTRTPLQRACRNATIGNVAALKTHDLDIGPTGDGFELGPDPATRQPNPFWVVRATRAVIDDHGGIWREPFLDFLARLLYAKSTTTGAGATPAARDGAGRTLAPLLKHVR